MRITQSTLARLGLAQLNDQRSRLARTQEQAATGLRINRPSDDPVDYRKVLFLKDASSQTSTYLRSIDLARVRLRATESALDGAEEVMSRAGALAVGAASSTNQNPGAAAALKTEVAQLFDEVLSYANVRAPGGGYVFSGLDSASPAFTRAGDFGPGVTPTVTFTGEASAIEVEIDDGVLIEVTRDGQAAFQGANDAFAALSRLWTGIDEGDVDEIRGAITDIESAREHLTQERTVLGGSDSKADSFEERLRLQEQNIATQVSFLEDADAFEVYSSLTAQETALQAALQVNARLLQPTLLDYI
ncbi:MAG: flagellar hook-associated protein FlgL [bacterium]|nr:flagellar hook-associated protein FlgL [bacterium]